MLPCSEGECNNYVWISIVSITTQSILYQLDCVRYYKIRQTIVLILRPSEHAKTSTSKRYISRSTCLKFNLKTVLNSDNHGGSNSRTAALIITLAKSVLSPLAAPLCTATSFADHDSIVFLVFLLFINTDLVNLAIIKNTDVSKVLFQKIMQLLFDPPPPNQT